MLESIINKINNNFNMFELGQNLLAVSGGVDSMVMLDIFKRMNVEFDVVHFNFKLRGEESDEDEVFVKNYCLNNNINCIVENFETKTIAKELKLSIQETARKLRYDYFDQTLTENNYIYVLTAHNLNDSFETFMINLSRGTGLTGLLGIQSQNGSIIRPIDFLTRNEILEYAKLYSISWREDSSNQEIYYLRNKIRHQITPFFEEINPSFFKTFSKTLENLNNSKYLETESLDSKFNQFVKINKKGDFIINIEMFLEFEPYPEVYLYGWLQEYGFKDWDAVNDLVYAETGKVVLGKSCYLIKDKRNLVLKFNDYVSEKKLNQEPIFILEKNQTDVNIGVILTQKIVNQYNNSSVNKIFVDQDLLTYPLIIRKKQKEDIIFPTSMNGRKKVSKFFKDQNMSIFEKESTYLLVNADEQIIWIIGHRQDRRFIITDETKTIVKFEIK